MNECYTRNNCSCNQNYIPVCTREDEITYFSPCHAGCSGQALVKGEKVSEDPAWNLEVHHASNNVFMLVYCP